MKEKITLPVVDAQVDLIDVLGQLALGDLVEWLDEFDDAELAEVGLRRIPPSALDQHLDAIRKSTRRA